MKTWDFINFEPDFGGGGMTKEGYPFIERDIDGYNDDLKRLIFEVTYHFEDVRNNVTVLRLVEKVKKELLEESDSMILP